MTTFIECDWCSRPIDLDAHDYEPDDYNRMGIECKSPDYVVMEATWGSGRSKAAYEFGHFHYPDCWRQATRLIRDHEAWTKAREQGPEAALMPHWTEAGELKDAEALPPRREPDLAERQTRRLNAIHGAGGISHLEVSCATYSVLIRADLLTVKQVQKAGPGGADQA